jgi:hypothetical protein
LNTISRSVAPPAITASSSFGAGSDFVTTRSASLVGARARRTAAMLAATRATSTTRVGWATPARFSAACSPAK